MAESNATQVILTDDGLKIIKAQQAAKSALTLANGKNKAYTSTSAPTSSSGYVSGDLWYVLIAGIVTDMYYFDGAKWQSYLQDAATLNVGKLSALSANLGNVNAGVLHGVDIYGSSFYAGDIINNANNTSNLHPTTISSNGHIYTTEFNSTDAMQTDLSTGALTTKYRAINTTSSNNQYEAYDTTLQADQIALFAGHTNGKDMSFAQSVTNSNQDGYMLLSPLNGITLHGDTQQITFNGTSDDITPKGIIITPYGNINPNGTQNIWYVGNGPTMKTASFGINADQNVPISFYRQTLVDEIGALGNRLPNGRLFLHATDNDAQMYLLNDGSPAFVSPTVFNRTYSNGANMFVTSSGRVGRSTSASKYKLAIARSDDTTQADRLMTLNPASWNDKVATEKMAESLLNGEIPVETEINLKRHYGLIAEDLRDAGLDEFLITGDNGQIEGIEYDRLWTVLIPKIKQLNNRINELERKTL